MKRALTPYVVILGLTALLYFIFYQLAVARNGDPALFDLVRFLPAQSSAAAHGTVIVTSVPALFVWSAILGLYAWAVTKASTFAGLAAGPWLYRTRTGIIWFGSCVVVAVAHPLFLITALPSRLWNWYREVVVEHVTALERIYYHWGIRQYIVPIVLMHTLLVCCVVALMRRGGPERAGETASSSHPARPLHSGRG